MAHDPQPPMARANAIRDLGALKMRSDRAADGSHVIALHGELDLFNTETIETELLRVEGTDAHQIIVDLTALELIDSSGLAVLIRANKRAPEVHLIDLGPAPEELIPAVVRWSDEAAHGRILRSARSLV